MRAEATQLEESSKNKTSNDFNHGRRVIFSRATGWRGGGIADDHTRRFVLAASSGFVTCLSRCGSRISLGSLIQSAESHAGRRINRTKSHEITAGRERERAEREKGGRGERFFLILAWSCETERSQERRAEAAR